MFNQVQQSLDSPLQLLKIILIIITIASVLVQLIFGGNDPTFCFIMVFLAIAINCRNVSLLSLKLFIAIILYLIIIKIDQLIHLLLNHTAGIQPDFSLRQDYPKLIIFNGVNILILLFGLLIQWRVYQKNRLVVILTRQWGIDDRIEDDF